MIKRVKELNSNALMGDESFRNYVENFESEVLRGIGTLCILNIIKEHGEDGIYGYQLLKELSEKTNDILVIEEGSLYPMLKKLENWGSAGKKIRLVSSERKKIGGRMRKYYSLTTEGLKVYNHIEGFFSKLMESIAGILNIKVKLQEERFFYCPNCANKIDLEIENNNFCEICGMNLIGIVPNKKNNINQGEEKNE